MRVYDILHFEMPVGNDFALYVAAGKYVRHGIFLGHILHQFKPASRTKEKPMAKWLSILLIALFSLSLLATSLHNHDGPEDHHTCSFCLLVQDFSAVEIVLKPVLIIPKVREAVIIPKSGKRIHTLIPATVHSRAPPV